MPPAGRPTAAIAPTLAAAQGALTAFWTWWTGELAGMAPSAWRDAGAGRRRGDDRLVLDAADGDALRLSLRLPGRGRDAATLAVPRAQPEAARERVCAFLHRHRAGPEVAIRIGAGDLFKTTLDLPRGAARALDQVVRHQIERILPLPAAELCIAHRMVPGIAKGDRMAVAVAVAKRAAVDEARAAAAAAGLTAVRALADTGEAGAPPMVLWQPARAAARRAPKRLLRTLEIAAAALLLGAYGLHLYRLESERDRLAAELQAESRRAAEARALGQQLARSSEALGALRALLDQPSPLQILNDLTALLPLDSWVSDLTIRGRSVEIVGQAPRAADLVAIIEASPMFGQARFRSPITLLPDGHVERFDLTLEVKERAK